jgi:hypothetical protein
LRWLYDQGVIEVHDQLIHLKAKPQPKTGKNTAESDA